MIEFIGKLYAMYAQAVRAKLKAQGVSDVDADDLCQTVFEIAVVKHEEISRNLYAAKKWLLGTARGLAANHRRLRRHRDEWINLGAVHRAPAPPKDPEEFLALQYSVRDLARSLSEKQREVLGRYHGLGETLEEIAADLGHGKGAVFYHLRTAQNRLGAAMARDERRAREAA